MAFWNTDKDLKSNMSLFGSILLWNINQGNLFNLITWKKSDDLLNGNPSKHVTIKSYAKVERIYEIRNKSFLPMLRRYHIWNDKYVQMRMNYNPTKPLNALLLRVYKLDQPMSLEIMPEWSGCKSWINIEMPEYVRFLENNGDINKLESLKPVIIDSQFKSITDEINEVCR